MFSSNFSKKVIAVVGFLAFFLIKSIAESALYRTPKHFRTKKYKYLEWRTIKGEPFTEILIKFHFDYEVEKDLYPFFT